MPTVTKQYDLFISISAFETFGITYVESLALGVPCIVYDYPTTRDVLPHSMAIFVSSFDPKIWSSVLLELQENPDIFSDLIQSIKKQYSQLEKYRLHKIVAQLLVVDKALATSK